MAEYTDKKAIVYENLKDAGCNAQFMKQCILLYEMNDVRELILQLTLHRKKQLKHLHQVQYEIDCLDYLLHQLKKMEESR